MDKYTHRIRIGATQLQHRYDFEDITINRYHKDDYLYGYYADGMLIGDEEPHNIAELIEEYEKESHIKQVLEFYEEGFRNVREAFIKLSKAFSEESEETEVKNIKWLKEEVRKEIREEIRTKPYAHGIRDGLRIALGLAKQLDEPEVLSQEFIDENKVARINNLRKMTTDDVVSVDKLQNLLVPKQGITTESTETVEKLMEISKLGMKLEFLSGLSLEEIVDKMGNGVLELVPKQELPVIPKFVADWIKKAKRYHSISWLLNYENIKGWSHELTLWCFESGNDDNLHKLARAWLDGYRVEEEQKYYVMNNEKELLLSKNNDDEVITYSQYYPQVRKVLSDLSHYQLTEQEIKEYDERYFAFAVKVE